MTLEYHHQKVFNLTPAIDSLFNQVSTTYHAVLFSTSQPAFEPGVRIT